MVTAVVKKTGKPLPSLPDAGFLDKKIINYGRARYAVSVLLMLYHHQ